MHKSNNIPILLLLLAGTLSLSCVHQPKPPREVFGHEERYKLLLQDLPAPKAELVASIELGMTFNDIAKLIPLSENDLVAITHGGAHFTVRLPHSLVSLRFDASALPRNQLPSRETLGHCTLNYLPQFQTYGGGLDNHERPAGLPNYASPP